MSEDFDSKLQVSLPLRSYDPIYLTIINCLFPHKDLDKKEPTSDDSDDDADDDEADKQMGETEEGAEKYVL